MTRKLKPRFLMASFVVLVCAASLPLIARLLGAQVLASPSWTMNLRILGPLACLSVAGIFLIALKRTRTSGNGLISAKSTNRSLEEFGATLIVFCLSWFIIYETLPHVSAYFTQKPVLYTYTVSGKNGFSKVRCGGHVFLAEMPFWTNRLCENGIRKYSRVRVGDEIVVEGRGSRWGVLLMKLEIVE